MIVVACFALVAQLAVIVVLLVVQHLDRKSWAAERRALVDRAIARHAGEVVGLDRNSNGRPAREHEPPKLIEGLS